MGTNKSSSQVGMTAQGSITTTPDGEHTVCQLFSVPKECLPECRVLTGMAMSEEADIWHSVLPAGLHLGAVVQARPWSTPTTTRKRLATVDYCLFPLRWELFLHWQLWCLTSGPENDPLFTGWLSWMEAKYLNGLIEYSVSGVLSSGGLLVSFPGLWIPASLVEDPFFALRAG